MIYLTKRGWLFLLLALGLFAWFAGCEDPRLIAEAEDREIGMMYR